MMKPLASCLALLLASFGIPAAAENLPPDVESFLGRRIACEHFIGEEPYDEERRRFLALKIRQACSGINEQGAATRELHLGNPTVLKALEPHQDRIELIRSAEVGCAAHPRGKAGLDPRTRTRVR